MKSSRQTIQAMEFSTPVSKNKVDLKLRAWKSVQDTVFGFFFFLKQFYSFIYGCAGSSLLHGLFSSCCERALGLFSSCRVQASHCSGFSCHGAWARGAQAVVVAAHGLSSCGSWVLEHRLNSCTLA